MVDFHSHVLPGMDDGAKDVATSLQMLAECTAQGVKALCATSHFYADQDCPEDFLRRRRASVDALVAGIREAGGKYPELHLGAEVLYFPGMCECEELKSLCIGRSPFLLIEPPMIRWSDMMLDEIELTGKNLHRIPVIAHIDRYMRILNDYTLFDRIGSRKVLIQANASFFLHSDTAKFAVECLEEGKIHFIGSDCHNLDSRPPNLQYAAEAITGMGAAWAGEYLHKRAYRLLHKDVKA